MNISIIWSQTKQAGGVIAEVILEKLNGQPHEEIG